jgi:transposase
MPRRPTYPPEFRRRIIDLARAGRSINSLSEEFTVARQSIVNWLKQDDLDSGRRDDGLTTEEHKELTLLRRENKRLNSPRPGSPGRQTPFRTSLRIHEGVPGRLHRHHALSRARGLSERLLRVAQPSAVETPAE